MLIKFLNFFIKKNNYFQLKNYTFKFENKRNYDSRLFRKSVRKLLYFFYKEVHPDLTSNLPDDLKKVNNESLSVLNSYIDILSSSKKNENNIFLEKSLVFFKVFENSENKIIKGRYKNIIIKLPTISNNLSFDEKEKITAKLIYDIKNSLEKTKRKNIFNDDIEEIEITDNILSTKETKKRGDINNIWEDLTNHVKDTEALYQPCEEEIELKKKKKSYFYYIKKKLELKFQKINHKKRRKKKLQKINEIASKIVQEKFPYNNKNNYDQILINQSYQIIQNGFNPNLIFFHKDINEKEKRIGIENLCGMHLKDDADKWLLENCLKLLKNHKTPIPLVVYSEKKIQLSLTYGFIYIPYEFCLNDLFTFLEDNIDKARNIRKKVLESFEL
ncbi:conserved protein, unknown function [Plasmodium gallinaceum]|uniref:DUF4460 domain-containing protein n=1 Tax=Plasmodium gallinaceum TaxID=5849 RepID=A0A1J1GUE2_PLAGA|nr:conserved protein, unknown function [Plasmodium gallinaceum]CRG95921.1 conserved protein, unknown function [Plasmodium gallinaceum]